MPAAAQAGAAWSGRPTSQQASQRVLDLSLSLTGRAGRASRARHQPGACGKAPAGQADRSHWVSGTLAWVTPPCCTLSAVR